MNNIDVLVATHKKINITLPKYCRLIQAGSAIHEKIDGYLYDDADITGRGTISYKNRSYCELTVLYYLWKQSNADIKGVYHYRRLFYNKGPLKTNNCRIRVREKDAAKYVLEETKIMSYLINYDVIVEIPYFPGVTTVREDLERFCYDEDIDKLGKVIQGFYPEYYNTFKLIMEGNHASYCNMLIAKKEIFDNYCDWLFAVLKKCEEVIDISGYDDDHKRIFGYFGEVLQNVYIKYHGLKEKQVPIMYIFEYLDHGKRPMWCRWIKMCIIQTCGKLNISLPTKNTPVMKEYNQECKHT